MKRCAECGRDYNDDSLKFCLDDGSELLFGPSSHVAQDDEPRTAILSESPALEHPTRAKTSGVGPGAGGHFDEPRTAILHETLEPSEAATRKITDASSHDQIPTVKPPSRRIDRRVLLVSGALAIVALVGYLGYRSYGTSERRITSLAVLPFENSTGNGELDYVSDGVSESVIDRLSQLPQLKVISRSSSFEYRGANAGLQQIAEALRVEAVVTGRVARRGDGYSIRVEMVDARENRNLWSQTFDRQTSDLRTLQSDIASEIAENLRIRLSGTQSSQLASLGTTNAAAYELLLKGRFHFNKAGAENFHKAVEYYEQSLAADPAFALAHAELASAFNYGGGRGLDWEQRLERQEAAARRAMQLGPDLAEANYALAELLRRRWAWVEAERAYQRAIELNPNFPQAYRGYAQFLGVVGRHDEAIAKARRGRELDPLSVHVTGQLARRLYSARRYDDALAMWRNLLELTPSAAILNVWSGDAYFMKGMYAEAIGQYQEAIRKRGVSVPAVEALLGVAYAKSGDTVRARQILETVRSQGDEPSELPQNFVSIKERSLALLYDSLGMRDDAIAELEKAVAKRNPDIPFIATDPAFDEMRSDPRFQNLVRRMGLTP